MKNRVINTYAYMLAAPENWSNRPDTFAGDELTIKEVHISVVFMS